MSDADQLLTSTFVRPTFHPAMHRHRHASALFIIFALSILAPQVSCEQATVIERPWGRYHFNRPDWVADADSLLPRVRSNLAQLLGDSLRYAPDIFIERSTREFEDQVGGRFPDWGAAAAIPLQRKIVVKSPDISPVGKSLTELLAHEYAHLAVSDRCGLFSPPRWFDEGVAMLVSLEWSWNDNIAMSKAAVFGEYIPLADIDNVNRFGENKAHVAYAQCYRAVEYLVRQYGSQGIQIFVQALALGQPVDSAMMASIGSTELQFQKELFDHLHANYNITTLFMDTIWLWTGLAFVVIIGFIIKRFQRRRYAKKWEDDERFQSTDFDYGDSPEEADDGDEPWRR